MATLGTYTYDAGLPTTKDQIRRLINDVDVDDDPNLADEEINWFYTQSGGRLYDAAADCCEAIAAKFSSRQDKMVGPLRVTFGTTVERYLKLADALRKRKFNRTGFSVQTTAPVRDAPIFQLGMHDNNDETSLAGTTINPALVGDIDGPLQ